MANELAGSAAYLEWIWSGGTLVMNTDFRNITYTPSLELIDATAGADANRQSIASFANASMGFSGVYTTGAGGGTAMNAALTEGNTGTINYGPAGTATNSPKITFPALVQGPSFNQPYSDVVEVSTTWAVYNGTVSYSNY